LHYVAASLGSVAATAMSVYNSTVAGMVCVPPCRHLAVVVAVEVVVRVDDVENGFDIDTKAGWLP